jgi:hypothetical protein
MMPWLIRELKRDTKLVAILIGMLIILSVAYCFLTLKSFSAVFVDGGRKRRRGDRVAAVQNGGAQPCSSLRGDDRGDRPDHTPFQREAQECTATWRFGARYDVRC